MSPIVIKTIQFFLSLSILIVLHELGHFIPAKYFKTRVEKFYLFFDVKFSLFKKKIGETEYGIGWLPLGGYVKISGMIDESMDKEAMAEEPKEWEFRSKPAWQRLIIMLGGVTVNFILAVVIFIGLAYAYGDQYVANDSLKDGIWVTDTTLGDALGVQTGDKILAVDGKKIESLNSIVPEVVYGENITIERNGQKIEKEIPVDFIETISNNKENARFISQRSPFIINAIPDGSPNANTGFEKGDALIEIEGTRVEYLDQVSPILEVNKGKTVNVIVKRNGTELPLEAKISDDGKIGVSLGFDSLEEYEKEGYFQVKQLDYTFIESIPAGWNKGVKTLTDYIKGMKKIFNPDTGAYKEVGGFAAIGGMFPDTWNWPAFWGTTAFISIILAFMNILPIPALDGGHVMFLLYEMITGRKPSDKFLEYAQITGFFILIALLLFANGNDVYKAIFK
ncbi:MAG: RIP metalloprotease RseP [Maribacter dokdonensis]|uniref:RIP metalloprotease RseP n=1 Tax=Maribacter TaxID=252356 RepID=UPI0007199AEC|nr:MULTISPECIES: RIP metalloprotease RseP [Maribacter]KSA12578.1 Membrane-associated zinc metalloprotease [Maribacter dokdonensis DSW-8]MDP2526487.1 RIP metalloprotease RseP [Maribacter dokdonensis]HAF78711.1 RIP metalloprotease RseP [Maribacter sp.]|tara:strand:- start:123 stop:1475 length:1353 start_codon:yes stop_codon:yes gene_type:complete